jgi:gamma-glutamylcyclotransferase (GGCT)/AIG2-like uncharacterized protein YtfP
MARTTKLFSYASNMNLGYLKSWLTQHGGRPDGIRGAAPATLADHRVVFNFPAVIGTTANLVKAAGETVHGVLLEVDDAALQKLEQKEHVPRAYQRVRVSVTDERGKVHDDAYALTAPPERCKEGVPKKKYVDIIIKGAEEFKLPAEYVAKFKAVKTEG